MVEICKRVLLSLDGVNISLNPLLPPRPAAEGDGEEEDDGGEASGHPKEQVLDKLGPGFQILNVNVDLVSPCADGLLDEVDVGVVNVDEDDGSDLEEEDDEDADAVEGEEALVLLFGSTISKEGNKEGDSAHRQEGKVEVLVGGRLLDCVLQPSHLPLHVVPLLSVLDVLCHFPETFIVHDPPDTSS